MVVIHEMTLFDLVVGHLDAPAQLWQDHYLDILVLEIDSLVFLVGLLVADALDDGIRIDHPTRPLIDTLLQEHRILLGFSHLIGWDRHYFSPSFYHNYISSFSNCSRLLPLVSGQRRKRKMKAQTQMAL